MPDCRGMSLCHINLEKGFRGGERQTMLLVESLIPYVRQTVVVRKGSPLAEKLSVIQGITVVEIPKPFLLSVRRLRRFSLIHAHEAKAGHLALAAKLLFSVPYVLTRRVAKKPKHAWLSRSVYSSAAQVVAISETVRSVVEGLGAGIRCRVIPSSFSRLDSDDERVDQLRRTYQGKFLIGHVGALENKDKGQIHIISAAGMLAEAYPEMHFLFLGSGSDQDWFEQASANLPSIELAGFKTNVGDYYRCFDLFLLPSLDEGLGSSILDAFYFKVPVIASCVGGIPDVVCHEQTGLLVPPGDEQALKQAIVRLYMDRNLAQDLALNGHASLARFDINRTKHTYLDVYAASWKSN